MRAIKYRIASIVSVFVIRGLPWVSEPNLPNATTAIASQFHIVITHLFSFIIRSPKILLTDLWLPHESGDAESAVTGGVLLDVGFTSSRLGVQAK